VSRFFASILLAAITALLWLSYSFAATHRIFGASALPAALNLAASVAAAALFIVLVTQIFLRYGFERMLHTEPTELQRRLVIAILTFVTTAVLLAHFGFDFSSILVFTTLITAVVGLSVQPMLGSLVSGLAVDRVLRVGDGILVNNEPVEITSLNWRSVMGRKADGMTVVVPNARLADNTLEVLQHDRALRVEARFDVPMAIAPHRLQKLAADLIGDFPEVDRSLPILVLPLSVDRLLPFQVMTMPDKGEQPAMRYRVNFWIRTFTQRAALEGRVLRHLWYALHREHATAPGYSTVASLLDSTTIALRTLHHQSDLQIAPDLKPEAVIEAGEVLVYDDGERIALPDRLAGHLCILIGGTLAETSPPEAGLLHAPGRPPARTAPRLTREASLVRIKHLLTQRIGPFAEYAVDLAAAGGVGLDVVCRTVAEEIEDPAARAKFLDAASPPPERLHNPGLLFPTRRNFAHRLLSDPPLRAVEHALILAAPEWVFKKPSLERL
jgi:small-conductance mechanosensitive channel